MEDDGESPAAQQAPEEDQEQQDGFESPPEDGSATAAQAVGSGGDSGGDPNSRLRAPRALRESRRRLFDSPAVPEVDPSSWLWLEDVEFARNDIEAPDSNVEGAEVPQIRSTGVSPAVVYSNQAHLFFDEGTEGTVVPRPLSDEAFTSGGFLSVQDPWYVGTQAVRPVPLLAPSTIYAIGNLLRRYATCILVPIQARQVFLRNASCGYIV